MKLFVRLGATNTINYFWIICALSCICLLMSCDTNSSFASKNKTLQGQVFIVTPIGGSLKLGLVEIGIHSQEAIDDWRQSATPVRQKNIETLGSQIEAQRLELDKLLTLREQKIREQEARNKKRPSLIRQYGEDEFRNYNRKLAAQIVEIDKNITSQAKAIEANEYSLTNLNSYVSACETLPEASRATRTDANGEFSLEVPTDQNFILTGYTTREVGRSVETLCWIVDLSTHERTDKYLLSNLNLLNGQWWDP